MKTKLIAIALLLAATSAADAKRMAPRPRPVAKCVKLTAKMQKAKQAADDFTAKAYAAALAKQKLTPTTLAASYREPYGNGKAKLAADQFEGPVMYEGYGGGWEFVADANGDVWAVDRAPSVTASTQYSICGCAPITHGGAAPREVQLVYSLPAGKQFKGHVKVVYEEHSVSYSYPENYNCPQPP